MIEKNKITVERVLAKNDLSKPDYGNPTIITITTLFDTEKSTFEFHATLPKHIFDGLVDQEPEKYWVERATIYNDWLKTEASYHETVVNSRKKKFNRKLSHYSLDGLLGMIEERNNDALRFKELETAENSKWIAICWGHSYSQTKDRLNFADSGKRVSSQFKWFVAYKLLPSKHSLNGVQWRSKKGISGQNSNSNFKRDWYYYGKNLDNDSSVQLVPWTQEREDFLQKIEDKFVQLNGDLDKFLGDLDEKKLELLMKNSPKLLT